MTMLVGGGGRGGGLRRRKEWYALEWWKSRRFGESRLTLTGVARATVVV